MIPVSQETCLLVQLTKSFEEKDRVKLGNGSCRYRKSGFIVPSIPLE
jgi:hypothetical protein